ncbi:MAG: hypothetical protein B7Z37_09980 [Verrucomicrobia bacterium 12-59-8]|nr:MAG: hypothetical protein B7Z37_09980 [Verrucomicrobia bacterium 12-59-8]
MARCQTSRPTSSKKRRFCSNSLMAGRCQNRELQTFSNLHQSEMRTPNRIVIVADHSTSTAFFRIALEMQRDLALAAVVTCASRSFTAVSQHQPDLVMISLDLPGHRILELVKDLAVLHPGLKFLIVSCHGQEFDAERVLRAGAHGCVTADSSAATKLAAVRQVLAGRHGFSSPVSPRPSRALGLHPAALAIGGVNVPAVL